MSARCTGRQRRTGLPRTCGAWLVATWLVLALPWAAAQPASSAAAAAAATSATSAISAASAASVASASAASASEAADPAASAAAADASASTLTGAASSASAPTPVPAAPPAPDPNTTVEQPRPFGHVLGDVLTQRVRLALATREVMPTTLPPADRVGPFLERRPPRLEQDGQGRRWLVIDYQVINAPRVLTALRLPALTIPTDGGPLHTAGWPISVGPLTPATAPFNQGGLQAMRPDRAVAPLSTTGIERQLTAALTVLAALLVLWAGWWGWRNLREAQRLPFARAWQQLRRLDPAGAEAWLALHHALNATAGRVVHGRTLPRLLAEAPHLQPLQAQLEAFFRHSEQRFFATAAGASPAGFALRDLGRALRDAERQSHR